MDKKLEPIIQALQEKYTTSIEEFRDEVHIFINAEQIVDAFQHAYVNEPFIRLTGDALPEIKHVAYTNFCDIGWRYEPSSRRLVIVSCIDNLVKGAAGQAVQNANLITDQPENAGLDGLALWP